MFDGSCTAQLVFVMALPCLITATYQIRVDCSVSYWTYTRKNIFMCWAVLCFALKKMKSSEFGDFLRMLLNIILCVCMLEKYFHFMSL